MNLITEAWIPVIDASGVRRRVRPAQVSEAGIVQFDARRADFNATLIQFMIGLLQTVAAPADEDAWRRWSENPPTPSELDALFNQVADLFELGDGDKRFMQTLGDDTGKLQPISDLLIDTPGQASLNTDRFVPRNRWPELGPADAALALMTLQLNAPSGGAGHRVSVRAGGPSTTLVLDDDDESLWALIWLNVLPADEWAFVPGDHTNLEIFPWAHPPRLSPGGEITTPEDVNPLQVFWATPRRIRLQFRGNRATGYRTRPRGPNYDGGWRHPLTPYYRDREGVNRAVRPREGGFGYRHWLGLTLGHGDEQQPALVVNYALRCRPAMRRRLWVFGYSMDNAEPRAWVNGRMPLHNLEDGADVVREMIECADQVGRSLRSEARKVTKAAPDLGSLLWLQTEELFYRELARLARGERVLQSWARRVSGTAREVFDVWAMGRGTDSNVLRRIALSRRAVIRTGARQVKRLTALDSEDLAA